MNNKFKIGDKVVRTFCTWAGMEVGDVGTVKGLEGLDTICLNEFKGSHAVQNFKLVQPSASEALAEGTIEPALITL